MGCKDTEERIITYLTSDMKFHDIYDKRVLRTNMHS